MTGPKSGTILVKTKVADSERIRIQIWIRIHELKLASNFEEEEKPVLQIRIRIHMFLGILDPDPLVRGMDPDPSIIKQK
jgi:hypothetical protein